MDLAESIERLERALDAAGVPRSRTQSSRWTPRDGSLAARIDHTLLRPEATPAEIRVLCDEARTYGFAGVCVAPVFVGLCARELADSAVAVIGVVGFPHGNHVPELKAVEAARSATEGARELDVVMHVGALRARDYHEVWRDLTGVVTAAGSGRLVKVILETALLGEEEQVAACLLAERAGAHFVKTSTGFGPGGATVDDVRRMRAVVGDRMGVKAAGGIRTRADAEALLAAGADRLGCSASVAIVAEARVA